MSASGTIVVAGYGPGIARSVALKFGKQGYKVALLARTQASLDAAVAELAKEGVQSKAYVIDLVNAADVTATLAKVSADLGPVSTLFWNPKGARAGLLDGALSGYDNAYQTLVTSLVAAVQAVHKDLKATKGAVLVTGSMLSVETEDVTQLAIEWNAASLAASKAAQRKLVHVMHKQLAADDIYVAEVTVMVLVKGSPFDVDGTSNTSPEQIADEFWSVFEKRDPNVWFVSIE